MKERYNLFSPAFRKDSYSIYEKLRKSDPVHCMFSDKGQQSWLITRYHDCVSFLKDDRLTMTPSSLYDYRRTTNMDSITHHLLHMDPPKHSELRRTAQRAITPLINKQFQEKILQIIQDRVISLKKQDHVELIKEYAEWVPIQILSELLGTSVEDYMRLFLLGKNLATFSEQRKEQAIPEILDILTYYIDHKKRKPSNDFISSFLFSNSSTSPTELYAMLLLFIMAGQETTTHLIGNGLVSFLNHPDEILQLNRNPYQIQPAIEEILRFMGPVEIASNRWAKEEIVWRGKRISKGDMVFICLTSANRDEEQFKNPESFQITRGNNQHIALGHGVHACLGGVLTRMIAKAAISSLLQEVDLEMRIPMDQLAWNPSFWIRGYNSIPVQIMV